MQIIPCCSQGMHSHVAMEQESKVCNVCLENIDFEDLFEVSTHTHNQTYNTMELELDKALKIKLAQTFAHEIIYFYEHKGIL